MDVFLTSRIKHLEASFSVTRLNTSLRMTRRAIDWNETQGGKKAHILT